MLSTWIYSQNVRLLLEIFGVEVGYQFDESDWDAVDFGLTGTNAGADLWFSYHWSARRGAARIDVELAWSDPVAGGAEIIVRGPARTEEPLATRLSAILSFLNSYVVVPRHSGQHPEP